MALAGLNRPADAIEPLQQYLAARPADRVRRVPRAADQYPAPKQPPGQGAQDPRANRGSGTQPPGFAAATHRLAEAAFAAGKYDEAIGLFGVLIQDGQPPEWASKGWSGLGWAQFRAGKAEAAAVAFGQLVDRYPESPLAAEGAMMKAKRWSNWTAEKMRWKPICWS